MSPEIEAWFAARIHNPRTLARALAANQGIQEGDLVRGVAGRRCSRIRRQFWQLGLVPRGQFLRRFGRAAWDAMPREFIIKDGRRMAVQAIGVLLHDLGRKGLPR